MVMNINVLLVEDDRALREALADTLLLAGHGFRAVASAEEALAAVAIESFSLVVSDVNMPGMDGKETFSRIRDMVGDSIPVIFLTGVAEKKKIVDVIKDKPAGYVLKPPDSGQLVGKIEAALAGRFNW